MSATVELAARLILAAWIAGTILGVPYLTMSESPAARRIRRAYRRIARR